MILGELTSFFLNTKLSEPTSFQVLLTQSTVLFLIIWVRVGKNLENESLILTSNFEVFPSSNLKKPQILRWGWGWHFDPQCKNADLILASKFEVFWGWDIFKKPQYFALFFKEFLEKKPYFCSFFRGFSRNPRKTSKLLPSSSPQTLRFFEVWGSKTSKVLCNPHPQKSSKFVQTQSSTSKNLKLWGWGWGSSDTEVLIAHPSLQHKNRKWR